jgi:hypothetical protein
VEFSCPITALIRSCKPFVARNVLQSNNPCPRDGPLSCVASMTGGEYELFTTHKAFEDRLVDFNNHLHSRYVLSFAPKAPHSGLHQIQVHLKQSLSRTTVLSRTSYRVQIPAKKWQGQLGSADLVHCATERDEFPPTTQLPIRSNVSSSSIAWSNERRQLWQSEGVIPINWSSDSRVSNWWRRSRNSSLA